MATNRDVRMIERALQEARTTPYRWKHGAVVARGNNILAIGSSRYRNNPLYVPDNASIHAECDALKGGYLQRS